VVVFAEFLVSSSFFSAGFEVVGRDFVSLVADFYSSLSALAA